MSTNPKLMSGECQPAFGVANSGDWPDVDWREINGKPHHRVATNLFAFRAIYGQRFGEAAPSGQGCITCQDGHGPFMACKIAYLPRVSDTKGKIFPSKALFGGSCMGCGLSGAGNRCSRWQPPEPQWVREYFMEKVPSLQLSVQFACKPYPTPAAHVLEQSQQQPQEGQQRNSSTPNGDARSSSGVITLTASPESSSTMLVASPRCRCSTFTTTSQGQVMSLPPPGARYISPLNEANVYNDIQSLEHVLSEVRLASARAAFDVDLLVRRREELLQKAN